DFAAEHGLKMGSIADLIHYRMVNERTIRRVREGVIDTEYGEFQLTAYRDQTDGDVHIALSRGAIAFDEPTPVRVHVQSVMRDLVTSKVSGRPAWHIGRAMRTVAERDRGVIVILSRAERAEQLLGSVDMVLGNGDAGAPPAPDSYTTVGLGSQILRDLGVGKIQLMGAPMKYNAISGFDLEVVDFLEPED
ncbi:MAG: bifunctional 3,4-dihydroxy-2-butanone-4-phosphate synthase/GTP cyclohydrolase II, partial [Halioglobus sp.]|nr:bifunctional 3,4-dihydroxy-2-butanone-4-phosphate synthase/GTP cyclohydrolase II [Halioglobus sp.]